MKEYKIIKLMIQPNISISELRSTLQTIAEYNKVFFEADIHPVDDTEGIRKRLKPYEHSVLHGLAKRPITLFANLGESWLRCNKKACTPLNSNEINDIITFADSSTITQSDFVTIIFDEIEWVPQRRCSGTYGYEKACEMYGHGVYLGNSVVTTRENGYNKHVIHCTISCESELRDSFSINQFIQKIGTVICEDTYYAPGDNERDDWNTLYLYEKQSFEQIKTIILDYYNNPSYYVTRRIPSYEVEKTLPPLKIQPVAKRIMRTSTWIEDKNSPGSKLTYKKSFGEITIMVTVLVARRGHQLNALMEYHSKFFNFGREDYYGINFSPICIEEVENYFKNIFQVFQLIEAFFKTH